METLKDIGEHNAIAALTANLKAVGDDCAVLPQSDSEYDLVLTSDPLIEGIHFTPDVAPEQIGHKVAGRVLSDFAAMGAEPQYLLVNVVAPGTENIERLEKVYAGLTALCDSFGAEVVGGDFAEGPAFELHVFGAGRVPEGTALLRGGASPGDALYVTGRLGRSQVLGHHLEFMPRVAEGQWLRECGFVTAMMDISDGLATDLRHILEASNTGAEIESSAVPLNGTIEEALFDGEDFELLFTVSPDREEEFLRTCPAKFQQSRVGIMTPESGIFRLDAEILDRKAYEHFK